MVLPTFAKTKVGRLPWRNPATQNITLDTGVRDTSAMRSTAIVFSGSYKVDKFPINTVML